MKRTSSSHNRSKRPVVLRFPSKWQVPNQKISDKKNFNDFALPLQKRAKIYFDLFRVVIWSARGQVDRQNKRPLVWRFQLSVTNREMAGSKRMRVTRLFDPTISAHLIALSKIYFHNF